MAMGTGHIGVNVTDLSRSERFYIEVFGLQRLGGSAEGARRFAFLGDGSRLSITLWEQSRGTFSAQSPGLHHLSFQASTMDDVRDAEARLKARGVQFVYDGVVPHAEGMDSGGIFFEDPDGIRLEIFAPAGAGDAKAPSGEAPSCGFFK